MVVGNHRRISTARGGCAIAIENVSRALPANTQNAPGGSVGGIANRVTRRLNAVSQTRPRLVTVLPKRLRQILDASGTGLCLRTHLNTSLVASWPPVT